MINTTSPLNNVQRAAVSDCVGYLLERLAQHKRQKAAIKVEATPKIEAAESQTVQAQDSATTAPPDDGVEQQLDFNSVQRGAQV